MKKQLLKYSESKKANNRLAAAVSYNPAQPLLSSARRSLQQPKHSLTHKSSKLHGLSLLNLYFNNYSSLAKLID